MGICIQHEACPQCRKLGRDRSGDNLARYSDGSAYCFSCGYTESATGIPAKGSKRPATAFPEVGGYLPTYLKEKLLKRGLNEFEVDSWYRHCPSWDCPAFVGFLPQYLELRTDRNPKVLSYGDKPFRPLAVNKHSDVVVLVEDAISAIKVARSGYAAMPLFGSKLGDYGGLRSVTIVWLDPDKTKEAFNLVDSLRSLGYTADVIPEFKQDPKDYSDSEIMNKLETVVSMQHVRNTLTKA